MSLQVHGGAGGVSVRLEELDALATALADAAADCGHLVAQVLQETARPDPFAGALEAPELVGDLVAAAGEAVGLLVRAGVELAGLATAVAAAAAAYRAGEAAVVGAVRTVPLVLVGRWYATAGTAALLGPVPLLGLGAAGAAGVALAGAGGAAGAPAGVDLLVRAAPGLLGVTDVRAAAGLVSRAGQATGLLVETPVAVHPLPAAPSCTVPAGGVADLLRRGQSVAAWREPGPGGHDTLPRGAPRPVPGQVRVDRVEGPDGRVAWVVHVPGTQEWDGDGHGSPMDMAGNVALVGGRGTAVASGVAGAMVRAGVRPGEPVAVVGHSQGGMTALDLAGDPAVRAVATVTHVVTAGSPVAGRPVPAGVQVLALEHGDDLVPRLDGRSHPDRVDRVTVRAPAPDGPWRADAVPAHSSSAYVATAERVDASDHPSLVAFRAGLTPFLVRDGAVCTSSHVVLTRAPGRHR